MQDMHTLMLIQALMKDLQKACHGLGQSWVKLADSRFMGELGNSWGSTGLAGGLAFTTSCTESVTSILVK